MAAKVWDRDEYRAHQRQRTADQRRAQARDVERRRREIHRGGFRAVLGALWGSIWHMGMYSSDPTIARMAMVHTAQEQIGIQRQISAAQRAQDEARDEQRMRMLAASFFDEAERRRA